MAGDRTSTSRASLSRLNTNSPTAAMPHGNLPEKQAGHSIEPEQSRPQSLEERILTSVASSLSISPSRLRESLAAHDDDASHSPALNSRSELASGPVATDHLIIKTQVLSGSKTIADMETEVVQPPSAHSMAASLVEYDGEENGSETSAESGEAEMKAQEDGREAERRATATDDHDIDASGEDSVDMRSASIMIAPEKIHHASRMMTKKLRNERQDFNKHAGTRNVDDTPPVPVSSLDEPTEVELFLGSEKAVSKVVVLKPRAGFFEDKVVACLTLNSIQPKEPEVSDVELVSPQQLFFAGTQISTIKQNLVNTEFASNPTIPEIWIPLDNMPMIEETDKIDRRKLRTWVQNANQDIFERVMSLSTDHPLQEPTTDMESAIQKLVARVLQVPPDQVGMNFTFAQMGGDEVTALALVTNARMESIFLESHNILHPNSTLGYLAVLATQRGGLAHKCTADQEKIAVESPSSPSARFFNLSAMQKLYFSTKMGADSTLRSSTDGNYRFNSSLLFRVAKGLGAHEISAAMDAVVSHHEMLRARFAKFNDEWMQQILPDVDGSYSLRHYTISTNEQVETVVHSAQSAINVENGPVFAAAHFQTTDGHQMLYLVAHHLVIDVASWRLIIHDLDELLQHGSLLSKRAMPFRTWAELQKQDAQLPSSGLPFDIFPGDLEFWGLRESNNAYADVEEVSFSMTEELTSILETTCNQVLKTEPVDIYISALMLSFAQTFPERRVPDVWNQEHGRDLWGNQVDISETVGWFTTLCPLHQQMSPSSDFIDVLRRLKDLRRSVPHRGAHYFASRFFTNDQTSNPNLSRPRSPSFLQIATRDWPIEILFSYAGKIMNLAKDNGVLEQMVLPGRTLEERTSDIGKAVGRIALFEVNTTIDHGSAKVKFLFNRQSKNADRIKAWIQNYEHLLLEAIGRLRYATPELTLSDIPQLWATGVTYEGLSKLNKAVVTDLGLSGVNDVEAVWPATPVQQSLLVGTTKQHAAKGSRSHLDGNGFSYSSFKRQPYSDDCDIHVMYEFASPDGAPVDLTRVVSAWDQVTARYPALRTVFIDSVAEEGLFNAVVLKRWTPNMLFLDANPGEDPAETLSNLPPLATNPTLRSVPKHRLAVCHSPMKTVVKLDVSAALCDMISVNQLIADLRRGYCTGRVLPIAASEREAFSYSGYLDILRGLDRERSIGWWVDSSKHVTRTRLFPRLDFYYNGEDTEAGAQRRYNNAHIVATDIPFQKVADFCRLHKTTTGTILRLAWGLVLRAITGSNAVCFGYRAPGRSATLEGMRTAIGCFSNTIAIPLDLSSFKPLGLLLRQIEDGYISALPHQHITMAEVRHALCAHHKGAGVDVQLFNTCFSFSEEPAELSSTLPGLGNLELRNVMNHETTDCDLTVNVRFRSSTGHLVIDIGHRILSDTQAQNLANTFGRAVSAIIKCTSSAIPIGSLDLFSDRDYAQIVDWTKPGDKDGQQQQRTLLHELVFAQGINRPDSKAICAHDGDLTYLQVELLSHRLAHKLVGAGVVPRGHGKAAVPVILDKTKWAPIALLAVLKAGAAFVPVDADEMGFVAKIAEELGPTSKVALACASAAGALDQAADPKPLFDYVIYLDDALIRSLADEIPVPGQLLPPSNPEDLACVFFTPTSSRSVRGISFTHAALSACFRAQGPVCGIKQSTRVLQLSSFNVDVALSEVFTTLVNGAVVCIPKSKERYNDYTGCVARFGVTWSYMTPLLARKLNVELLTTLKVVCFRTRGLDQDTYAPWRGQKRVIMAYGAPDVCPLGISFLEIHGPHHLRAIGKPIVGSAWIVSGEDHRNLMPVGAVGEMVIEGPTLGKTFRPIYLATEDDGKEGSEALAGAESQESPITGGTSAQTHQKYPSISSISSDESPAQGKKRYYKTGHSVRYIEAGLMEYVSSKRDDLEINGHTVNLAELEQHIRRTLGQGVDVMVEALAFKGERSKAPTLAAFLELGIDVENGESTSYSLDLANLSDELKQRVNSAKCLVERKLKSTFPECIIPKIFIPVRHLPTTYSLKVNRRKLQKVIRGMSREQLLALGTVHNVEHNAKHLDAKPVRLGGMEEQVRAVWARVLGVEERSISSQDGFLKSGGDEISAAEVIVQCRKDRLLVSIAELMSNAPLAEICRSNGSYAIAPDQSTTTLSTLDEVSEQEFTPDTALDNAHTSLEHEDEGQEEPRPLEESQTQPSDALLHAAATTLAPQVIDRTFIAQTLAPKLLLEPDSIRDVAEATSTQIRHIETAILTHSQPRLSGSSYGPSLTSVNYFTFQFTAASSTSSVSARRIEDVCHILASIHPILRTAFVPHVEGQNRKLYQVIMKNHKVDFKHISRVQGWRLGATVDKEIKKDRERLLNQTDLFYRPLTRFIFLDAGKTSALVLRLSRAQYDDLSITLLLKDLKKLYDGGQNPPRRPSFADFVREAALANVGGEAERYWRGLLDGAVPTQVVRHLKPPKLSNSVRTMREYVSVNTTSLGGLGIELDTVLKAAWGMVLATFSGTPDVVFGEVVEGCHSRLQHHLGPSSVNRGGVLGPTSTVLPVRICFAENPTSPLHLMNCIADQRADAVPYENLGMLDIVEKCTPWPYWTRLSTVVQHRADAELLTDGKTKTFRLGAAVCKVGVVESEWVDIPDFLVRSTIRSKTAAGASEAEKQATDARRASLRDGDEELEVTVNFCEQRVPPNLAQEMLHKVCGYVGLLTGFSIMQNVVPTAAQYASLAKQIPLATPAFGSSSTATSGVTFNNPFGAGAIKVNYAQLEAKMSPDQITTIQSTIEDAWRSTLDPRALGVPEEHVTTAAFFDLWGSLIPAAQLAEYLTEEVPSRLVAELSMNLFGGNLDGFRVTMEEVVDNPTMIAQFELIVRKAFGGEGRDRSFSLRNRSSSIPHSVRKSSSLTSLNNDSIRTTGAGSVSSGVGFNGPIRAGTISVHGPSKLGHSRTRSDSTDHTAGSSNSESLGSSSKPLFPAHPAVKPPVNNHPSAQLPFRGQHSRKNSDASNSTSHSGTALTTTTRSVITAPTSTMNTPATSVDDPDASELPGSAAHQHLKRSNSIRAGEPGPESPVLGNANLGVSPPVVQTGFVAARKKTNFGIGSSLRRMASNALRPGLHSQNTGNNHANSSSSSKMLQPPKSSGSDRSWTSQRDKDGKERIIPAPVSPWMRVQSMAPQLPPFSPFTPVTEDGFSLRSGDSSSDRQRTRQSPGPSQGEASGTTSPDLVMKRLQDYNTAPSVHTEGASSRADEQSWTHAAHDDGILHSSMPEYPGDGNSGMTWDSGDQWQQDLDEEDEEGTLRPDAAQQLLLDSMQLQASQESHQSDGQQATRRHRIQEQQDAQPSPSPITETFYMEDDEHSETEDVYLYQYDSDGEIEEGPATPRQRDSRPVTVIHSPQLNGPTRSSAVPGAKRRSSQNASPQKSPRYGVFPRDPLSDPPVPSNAKAEKMLGIGMQDFASLEAAEMHDTVSPLTPVERAMLYKQQGAHRNANQQRGGVASVRAVLGSLTPGVSPLTPGSYFPQQQGSSQMGGFHAI